MRLAGNRRAIDGADQDAGHSVGMKIGLGQCLTGSRAAGLGSRGGIPQASRSRASGLGTRGPTPAAAAEVVVDAATDDPLGEADAVTANREAARVAIGYWSSIPGRSRSRNPSHGQHSHRHRARPNYRPHYTGRSWLDTKAATSLSRLPVRAVPPKPTCDGRRHKPLHHLRPNSLTWAKSSSVSPKDIDEGPN
jgi:hypothetical protein